MVWQGRGIWTLDVPLELQDYWQELEHNSPIRIEHLAYLSVLPLLHGFSNMDPKKKTKEKGEKFLKNFKHPKDAWTLQFCHQIDIG